ncbi:hypothetical protein IHN32_06805 [Deinococcus sp. 14RED07]|uniref:DUF5819 family protein n=1 Tax=Deinococcus sp. 14RED07 TaxID=2745874 RepID=UPI001E2F3D69|nr:DUF5819 family protein [Deinococcus sp. 14RED07]MCD0175656.1 hypothetical protein [Deinococcus sp. 14RED07]
MRHLLYTLAILLFCAYFALTALYVTPINPIKTQTNIHNMFIGKFFYQDWGLFAPNPVASNTEVHVQCLAPQYVTHMMNISQGLWERHRQNRVSSYDRLGRVVGNYAHSVFSISRQEVILRRECDSNPQSGSCFRSRQLRQDSIDFATQGLTRVAASFCNDQGRATGKHFDHAQIFLSTQAVRPWSQRHRPPVAARFVDLGRHTLPTLPAPGIWR